MNVTILGGTGLLGRHLTPLLFDRGHQVTITGRSAPETRPGARGVRVDLATGEGLAEAISSAETVVHLASDPVRAKKVDVLGTDRLLEQMGDRHLVYMSIVGVDRHPMSYYRNKLATERLIEGAAGLYTIVRATLFHHYVAYLVDRMTHFPVARVPKGFVYQPIDIRDVAEEIAVLVETRPQGRAPDLAGPEVLGVVHLARTYMTAKGKKRPLIEIPRLGPVAKAFRDGVHTNPERAVGKITWADHLERRFGNR